MQKLDPNVRISGLRMTYLQIMILCWPWPIFGKVQWSELIMTQADVHVDGDDSDLDKRGLLHKICSQMQHHFTTLDRKIGSNLEKAIKDAVT